MTTRGLVAILWTLGVSGCSGTAAAPPRAPAPASATEVAAPLATVFDEIIDQWLLTHPVTATGLGDHRNDGAWPGLSANDQADDRQRVDKALARLAAVDRTSLTPAERVDIEMVHHELERQRFVHEVEQPWQRNPLHYAQLIGAGLDDLVSRDYAPVTERARAVVGRLEGLPALVQQALINLQPGAIMAPHTRVALEQLGGMSTLLEELPDRLASAPAPERQRLRAALPSARDAVGRLHEHIDRLSGSATAPWRLGPDAFARKLRLTLHTEWSAEQIQQLAAREHERVRRAMAELAGRLAPTLLPPARLGPLNHAPDPERALTAAVLDELSCDRVAPDELRDRVAQTLTVLDRFVREHQIVTLDDSEVLEVIWTPPYQRGVAIAGLAAPGPLDATRPGLPSFYLVQPIPAQWAPAAQESLLREYNNFMIEILSIHEAIPGHFVQLYYGKREPSKVRRLLANGPFVEGWAVYAERVMVEAGYPGAPPTGDRPPGVSQRLWTVMTDPPLRAQAIALHGLKFYLRTVTNARLDYSIHAQQMTEAQALQLMVDQSFQQPGEAQAKWVRAQVSSTQLSTYFVGSQAWFRLRAQAQARADAAGRSFDLQAFHDEALRHGAPPVHHLPALMGWSPLSP